MPIYCDESGGVGRGVMTLAAIFIDAKESDALLERYRNVTGWRGELKGSRIDFAERALIVEMLADSSALIHVGIAISALIPRPNEDRGNHDIAIYSALVDDVVASLLPATGGCAEVVIDDGRYGPETLARVRKEIADIVGPCGNTRMELSHRSAGLQFADVIANSFFNRALVSGKQARIAAMVQPLLDSGKVKLRILEPQAT